jgi:hypothetical protein
MKYSLDELHDLILPIVLAYGRMSPVDLTNAIIEIIRQDREANAKTDKT